MTEDVLEQLIMQAFSYELKGEYENASSIANQVIHELKMPHSAIELGSIHGLLYAKAVRILGGVAFGYGNLSEALAYFEEGLHICENAKKGDSIADFHTLIGEVLMYQSDFSRSLEYFTKALSFYEETNNIQGVAQVLQPLGSLYLSISDYSAALECHNRALRLGEEINNKNLIVVNLASLGNVYYKLADFAKAIESYSRSMAQFEELGLKSGVSNSLSNMGNVYEALSDYQTALECHERSLNISQELGASHSVAVSLGNIGNVHFQLKNYPLALECHEKALKICEDLGIMEGVAANLASIGADFSEQGAYDEAFEKYNRALEIYINLGMKAEAADTQSFIGELFAKANWTGRDERKAEEFLLEAISTSHDLDTKRFTFHKSLSELYESQKRWEDCYKHHKIFHDLKEEVLSAEVKQTANRVQQQRQLAEQEKEIAIAKAAADAQMHATTALLFKVLPETVATRMINGEEEIADHFPNVSILFADISGFTPISADMPAIIVVRFLNYVFGEFDRVMKKHGCEKIKTMGDGYMAVAGAPIECEDHAERLVAAAIEIRDTIRLPDSIKEYLPAGLSFGVRIGLHTGPVVAGVIGEERFVYDVYSDAVNTAARMESHGEANRIHVSSDFYNHMQNRQTSAQSTHRAFGFVDRGELDIKGKGKMRTYFLE